MPYEPLSILYTEADTEGQTGGVADPGPAAKRPPHQDSEPKPGAFSVDPSQPLTIAPGI